MRDVATLVWVVLLVIGVVSSMVASVRRRMNALPPRGWAPSPPGVPPAQAPQLGQQLVQQMKQVPGRPAGPPVAATSAAAAAATAPAPTVSAPAPRRRRLFPGGQGLVSAVIAAEVLGKPRALRDEYFGS
jgi:hypothetical protein